MRGIGHLDQRREWDSLSVLTPLAWTRTMSLPSTLEPCVSVPLSRVETGPGHLPDRIAEKASAHVPLILWITMLIPDENAERLSD